MNSGFLGLVDRTRRIEDGPSLAEPPYVSSLDVAQPDDIVLDGWLASLTPKELEHILNSLAGECIASSARAG